MTQTPEQIAAVITEAQKRLLLWLHPSDFKDWLASGAPTGNRRTRHAVTDLTEYYVQGPVSCYFLRRLNALGQSVAAILKEQTNAD